VERVKAAIIAARRNGIDAQVEGVTGPAHHRRESTITYDTPGTVPHGKPRGLTTVQMDNTAINLVPINTLVDSAPRPILLLRENLAKSAETLELTIDAAGKVWSAKMNGSANDPELLEAARDWKFIPAYRGGRPVACRDLLEVSPEQ
jgi:outer membrane biosynthesis protein TonB